MTPQTPDWIAEGAKVAEYATGGLGRVTISTVTKLTATQVVLDNGNRYRRDNLYRVGEARGSWSGRTELRAVGDRQVRDVVANEQIGHIAYRVGEMRRDRIDVAKALACLDQIERLVAVARSVIGTPQADADMARAAGVADEKEN